MYIDEVYESMKNDPSLEAQGLLKKILKVDPKFALPIALEFLFVGFGTVTVVLKSNRIVV